MQARGLTKPWQEALHPAVDGGTIHCDTALDKPLHDIGVAKPKPDVPAHCERYHVIREVMVGEGTRGAGGETPRTLSAPPTLAT